MRIFRFFITMTIGPAIKPVFTLTQKQKLKQNLCFCFRPYSHRSRSTEGVVTAVNQLQYIQLSIGLHSINDIHSVADFILKLGDGRGKKFSPSPNC